MQEGIGQRAGGLNRELEQRALARAYIALAARIEDQPNIGDTLLLELVDEQGLRITRGRPGVDPARGVARLIFAHAIELYAWPTLPCRDLAGVDLGASR